MNSWPAYRASAIHQWQGLSAHEREIVDSMARTRETYDVGGCTPGGAFAAPQHARVIWSVERGDGSQFDLISVKEDLDPVIDGEKGLMPWA